MQSLRKIRDYLLLTGSSNAVAWLWFPSQPEEEERKNPVVCNQLSHECFWIYKVCKLRPATRNANLRLANPVMVFSKKTVEKKTRLLPTSYFSWKSWSVWLWARHHKPTNYWNNRASSARLPAISIPCELWSIVNCNHLSLHLFRRDSEKKDPFSRTGTTSLPSTAQVVLCFQLYRGGHKSRKAASERSLAITTCSPSSSSSQVYSAIGRVNGLRIKTE